MATAPVINSVTFYPSDISMDTRVTGVMFEALDGSRRASRRNKKLDITLTWNKVSLTILNQVRALAALTTTFTLVDENGTSYTVLCPVDTNPLSSSVADVLQGGTVEYNVTLQVIEA